MNSLYGRFGLKPELQDIRILDSSLIDTIQLENDIIDIIEFPNTNKSMVIINKIMDNLNASVAIASAITAHARLIVAPILLDDSIKVLYTDTDSYVIEGDLSTLNNGKYSHLLHNGLGGLKLEAIFTEFIALGPKVYGGLTLDNGFRVKVKGYKDKVEFDRLKYILLNQDKVILSNDKWYRSIKDGTINIKNNPYTLELNENKRKLDIENLITLPYHFT